MVRSRRLRFIPFDLARQPVDVEHYCGLRVVRAKWLGRKGEEKGREKKEKKGGGRRKIREGKRGKGEKERRGKGAG